MSWWETPANSYTTVLRFDWLCGVPKVLIYSLTGLFFTVCIFPLVCVCTFQTYCQACAIFKWLFLYDNIVAPVGGDKCLFSETLNYSLNWFIQELSKWRRYNRVIKSFTELIHSKTLIQSAMKQVFKSELVNSSLMKKWKKNIMYVAWKCNGWFFDFVLNYFGGAKIGTRNLQYCV